MNKEALIFGDMVIDKQKFLYPKNRIWIDYVDIDELLRSYKVSFGEKVYE